MQIAPNGYGMTAATGSATDLAKLQAALASELQRLPSEPRVRVSTRKHGCSSGSGGDLHTFSLMESPSEDST